MKKVAINGFGRIGRLFLRQSLESQKMEVVAINDLGSSESLAYLLKYDSVYRKLEGEVRLDNGYLVVGNRRIKLLSEKEPEKLPWREMNIGVVVEATGVFTKYSEAKRHLEAGAKRVVITAPARDEEGVEGGKTILVGVNDGEIGQTNLTCNGSCTTNAVASVLAILEGTVGVKKAILNTVHAYTASQSLVDEVVAKGDLRKGRAAAENIVLTSTGAAIAVARALPDLAGKFDGVAMRVPVVAGSVADLTVVTKEKTSREEINKTFREASRNPIWGGVLGVTEEPIVSSDIIGEPYGAIVDLSATMVVDEDLVKIMSWYDNEWGYVSTLIKHVERAE